MSGFRTRITGVKLKDGKLVLAPVYRSVSQRLRAMKSTKVRVKRKGQTK